MNFKEELQQKKFMKFLHSFGTNENFQDESFGGIIHNGKFGWLARGPQFEVYSMKNGQKISYFHFDNNFGFEHAIITSITEIESLNFNDCILAIGIQFGDLPGGCVAIYSVQGSKILRCIEIPDKITCCHYINNAITRKTILQMMEGCLAFGTDNGKIILLDLNLSKCKNVLYSSDSIEDHILLIPCQLVKSSLEFIHIRQHFKHSIQENINFGIELEVIENAGIVLSLLSILPSLVLAAGLEDGRMVIYDLSELQALHLANPPKELSPLVKLDFLEPPDDPRACIYVWAFHENPEISVAVMHCLMYEKKYLDDEIFCYEDFQSCDVRLTLPIYDMKSIPITCHTITKIATHGNEETISLCLLSCKSLEHHTQIFVFDLNQWYKEEMPEIGDWRRSLSYLAVFSLKHCQPFDTYIDLNTIALFNSIQRSEEHFYPIALSFDLTMLFAQGSELLHWPGLQNQTLDSLNSVGSTVFLEPGQHFSEIIRSNLMPQFCDHNYKSTFSIKMQREIILSVALEYNCFGILKDCARSWEDGSHLGHRPTDGLSMSTLTEWIWKRAGQIKKRCNLLSVSLFDHSGIILDQRSRKELFHLTRQLKLLTELFDIILNKSSNCIPADIIETLNFQHLSVKMSYEYQEVLLWFLNVGLLPEPSPILIDDYTNGVKYPYSTLKKFYEQRRTKFYKLNNSTLSTRTKSCKILYIDSFIEHECNANTLREQWLEGGSSNGLYPPPSLQAMLRTLLVPEVSLQNKYILFIYLFLDLHMCAIKNEKSAEIVKNLIKFPAVFKLNASVIKTVQAFWNLDHEQFEFALDEIISPFSQDKKLKQWQQELLIESFLSQQQPHLALRALQARTSPINSLLELKTLMTNNLIAEAFHLARLKCDDDLMKTFLSGCIYLGKWEVLRDLALTDNESYIVSELLKSSKSEKAGNLHFMMLLEKEKYIEALQFLDEMSIKKTAGDIETSKLILQAYNITMTPASKSLSDIYYKNREKLELSAKSFKNFHVNKSEDYNSRQIDSSSLPLSCQFLNQKPYDSIGGIYETSALSIDFATNYWETSQHSLLKPQNVPFIRNPQMELYNEGIKDLISYPEQYKITQKRIREDSFEDVPDQCRMNINPLKKRRIMGETSNKNRLLKPINVSLLTKFKSKPNSSFDLDKALKQNSVRVRSAQTSEHDEKMILDTPLIKSSVKAIKDSDLYKIKNEENVTPHSILKTKTQQELILHTPYNEKPPLTKELEGEKSIHFDLTIKESSVSNASISDSESQEERTSVKHSSTVQKNYDSREGITCRYDCPQRRRSIHSLNSSIVSGTSLEEFFSPISSRNTTQNNSQTEEPEIIQKTPIREEISKDSGAYVNMSSGGSTSVTTTLSSSRSPHYKPITRRAISQSKSKTPERRIDELKLNVTPKQITKNSRKSRSKTPEIMMSPSRRSSRILALKSNSNPDDILHSPIARAISLTRQVLESNALKIVENNKDLLPLIQTNIDVSEQNLRKISETLEKSEIEQNISTPYETLKESEPSYRISNDSTIIENEFPKITTIEEVSRMETDEIIETKSIVCDASFVNDPYFEDGTSDSVLNCNSNIFTDTFIQNNDDEHAIIAEDTVENVRLQISLEEIEHRENDAISYLKDELLVNNEFQVGYEYERQEYEVEVDQKSSTICDSDTYDEEDNIDEDEDDINESEDYVIDISSSSSNNKSELFDDNKISNLLYDDIDSQKFSTEDSTAPSQNSSNCDLFNSAIKSNEGAINYIPSDSIIEHREENVIDSNKNMESPPRQEDTLNVIVEQSSFETPTYENLVDDDDNLTEAIIKNDHFASQNYEGISTTESIDQIQLSKVEINKISKTALQLKKNVIATLDTENKLKKNLNDSQEMLLFNLEEKVDELSYKRNLRSRGIRAQSVGLDESISQNNSITDSPNTRRKLRAMSVPKNASTLANTPRKTKSGLDSNIELSTTPRRAYRTLRRIEENQDIMSELSQIKKTRKRLDSSASDEISQGVTPKKTARSKNKSRGISESSVSGEEIIEEKSNETTSVNSSLKNEPKAKKVPKRRVSADPIISDSAPNLESRRLTRTQQKMLEKSAIIADANKILPLPKKVQVKLAVAEKDCSPKKTKSETESVASVKTKVGRKRGTKSEDRVQIPSKDENETKKIAPKKRERSTRKIDDDTESVSSVKSKASDDSTSKSTRGRKSKIDKTEAGTSANTADFSKIRKKNIKPDATTKKDVNLGVIPEENEEGDIDPENLDEDNSEIEEDDDISDVSSVHEKAKSVKSYKSNSKPIKKRK